MRRAHNLTAAQIVNLMANGIRIIFNEEDIIKFKNELDFNKVKLTGTFTMDTVHTLDGTNIDVVMDSNIVDYIDLSNIQKLIIERNSSSAPMFDISTAGALTELTINDDLSYYLLPTQNLTFLKITSKKIDPDLPIAETLELHNVQNLNITITSAYKKVKFINCRGEFTVDANTNLEEFELTGGYTTFTEFPTCDILSIDHQEITHANSTNIQSSCKKLVLSGLYNIEQGVGELLNAITEVDINSCLLIANELNTIPNLTTINTSSECRIFKSAFNLIGNKLSGDNYILIQ